MQIRSSVLVTGATGFVGRHVVRDLQRRGYRVCAASRTPLSCDDIDYRKLPDLRARPEELVEQFAQLLAGFDFIVHTAALAHTDAPQSDQHYMAINADASEALAIAARIASIQRIVFLSSVRAQTGPSFCGTVDETAPAAPSDAYGRSKRAAEIAIEAALLYSQTSWIALRPVLVYGPGVKGNMETLIQWARSSWPLPFGSITARRSLLSVENLVAAIVHALQPTTPSNASYLVADDNAVSLADIITALRAGLLRSPGLLNVSPKVIEWGLHFTGRRRDIDRLLGSLVVETARLRETGWQPAGSTLSALQQLAALNR